MTLEGREGDFASLCSKLTGMCTTTRLVGYLVEVVLSRAELGDLVPIIETVPVDLRGIPRLLGVYSPARKIRPGFPFERKQQDVP